MIIQIAAATVGSLGFAIFLKMRGRQIALAGLGGAVTWAVCLICQQYIEGNFIPYFVASIFVAIYAEVMARVNRAPATIFLTAAAVPLIPGGSLYYTMAGLVNGRRVHARRKRQRRGDYSLGYFPGVCSSIRHHQIYKSFPGQKSLVITFPKK